MTDLSPRARALIDQTMAAHGAAMRAYCDALARKWPVPDFGGDDLLQESVLRTAARIDVNEGLDDPVSIHKFFNTVARRLAQARSQRHATYIRQLTVIATHLPAHGGTVEVGSSINDRIRVMLEDLPPIVAGAHAFHSTCFVLRAINELSYADIAAFFEDLCQRLPVPMPDVPVLAMELAETRLGARLRSSTLSLLPHVRGCDREVNKVLLAWRRMGAAYWTEGKHGRLRLWKHSVLAEIRKQLAPSSLGSSAGGA